MLFTYSEIPVNE